MNTQTQEALKMAIEQMNVYAHIHLCEHQCQDEELLDVIQACKEALAQPAQEIGDAEIRQMLNDIEYYQKRVEELEQPAQEPVAWMYEDELTSTYPYDVMFQYSAIRDGVRMFPVFHPATSWQELSDDEIDKIYYKTFDTWSSEVDIEFSRAIEQALKEKNT